MKKATNSVRLFLCTFSGEDNFIIKKCSIVIQITFALIGVFVIGIFIGCFTSAFEFFNSLFQGNFLISFPIGIIWALLVTNIYLLLLYTVSPAILPTKKKKGNINNNFFTTSMFFRISFMSLLAIIIAQPLNVLFFNTYVQTSLKKHILEEKTKMVIIADSLLIKNETILFQDFNRQVNLSCSIDEKIRVQENLSLIDDKIKGDETFIRQSKKMFIKFNNLENKVWLNSNEKKLSDKILNDLSVLTDVEISSDKTFLYKIDSVNISNHLLSPEFNKYKNNLKKVINQKLDNYQKLEYLLSK